MRQLILLRHGEAEPHAASGRDLDRALTARGRRDAARAGEVLAAAGFLPARALVSAARRTQETWAAAAPALGERAADVREPFYDALAERLLQAARACEEDVVMVVAHNPGLGELAAQLGGGQAPFPPAALAVFAWDEGEGEGGGGGAGPRLLLRRDPD